MCNAMARPRAQVYRGNPVRNPLVEERIDTQWVLHVRMGYKPIDNTEWLALKLWTPLCQGKANYWLSWSVTHKRFARSLEYRELEQRQPLVLPKVRNTCHAHAAAWWAAAVAKGAVATGYRPQKPM